MKDIIRMNQLAGLITEGQAKKMMEVLDENNEFSKLLNDLNDLDTYLKTYNGEEAPGEEAPGEEAPGEEAPGEEATYEDDPEEDDPEEEATGEEVTYEDDPEEQEISVTIYPGYRQDIIIDYINAVLKKNKSFKKENIQKYRDVDGIMISFDIVKK